MNPREGVNSGDSLDRYLLALFAHTRRSTFVEIRWSVPRGMHRLFVPTTDLAHVRAKILAYTPHTDVFVAVLPRWKRAGHRAAVVGDCRTVWIDLDIETATQALEPVDPPPAVVVASGGPSHLHAYWSLRAAVPPGEIERANRRLAWALGGDLSSTDATRILRPPASLHHGRGRRPVRLISEAEPEPCRIGALVGGLADPPLAHGRPATTPRRRAAGDPLLAISPGRYVPELTGQTLGRDRKVRCPLHPDRTPSLHAYPHPADGWFCFGCRRGGSIYDLAAALWGIDTRGSAFVRLRDRLTVENSVSAEPAPGRRQTRPPQLVATDLHRGCA